METFSTLGKYPNKKKLPGIGLYSIIRCGLCHDLLPQEGIVLSDKEAQNLKSVPIILNINKFYIYFIQACQDLLGAKVNLGKNKTLDMEFISVVNGNTPTGEMFSTSAKT